MPDRISRYRQVRLIIDVPHADGRLAHWSLMGIHVRRGIPDSRLIASGVVPLSGPTPSVQQVYDALDSVVGLLRIDR